MIIRNRTWLYPLVLTGVMIMLITSCKKEDNNNNKPQETLTDIDGNVYHTIIIGTQVWMLENLKTTKYRDGTIIPNVTDNAEWIDLTTGAYSNYDNTPSNSAIYGKLYNWYAVSSALNIAPVGWHVPTDKEWITLSNYLGGELIAGGKLKENGTQHWNIPNTTATNESGFTALPGGSRIGIISFEGVGYKGSWWSATEYNDRTAWDWYLVNSYEIVYRENSLKSDGCSVRCIKD